MGYDLMPVPGCSFAPQQTVCVDRNNNKHHLLGSALLGGTAAYGAYKLNLDIVKDSMSASAFEDAIRSGKRIDFSQSLTRDERNALAQARKDVTPVKNPEIGRIFSGQENLTFYDFLKERYPDGNIKTPQDLERAITAQEKRTDTSNDSHASDIEKFDRRRPQIQELKKQSDQISRAEKQILDLSAKKTSVEEALTWHRIQKPAAGSDAAKKLALDIKTAQNELKDIEQRLINFKNQRSTAASEIEKLLKSANITGDTIDKISNGAFKEVKELTSTLRATDIVANQDAIAKRTTFINEYYDSALAKHNELLKNRPKANEKIAGMKADLELVKAAEAGDGFVTKSMAQETYQRLASDAGKGEESIAKAFESLGKKLPKELGGWKKAGLLGALVALGLYCFND